MLTSNSIVFSTHSHIGQGHISEDFLHLIIHNELNEPITSVVDEIKTSFHQRKPSNLQSFKESIDSILAQHNTSPYSIAALLQCQNIVYLFTCGEGEIYIKRESEFNKIIDKTRTASGFIKDGDLFILGLNPFFEKINTSNLAYIFNSPILPDVLEDLHANIQDGPHNAMLVKFNYITDEVTYKTENSQSKTIPNSSISQANIELPEESISQTNTMEDVAQDEEPSEEPEVNSIPSGSIKDRLSEYAKRSTHGRKITIAMAVILLSIFVWSVGFGIQRRTKGETAKKVQFYKERINAKLSEASDLATLNSERSQLLVQEAKKDFKDLKNEVGENNSKDIELLDKQIQEKERQILKREDKQAEEFYNLDLISDNAVGSVMYLEDDQMSVLNNETGEVYLISVSKKSKEIFKKNAFKNGRLLTTYQGDVFLLSSDGIYKANEDKQERVVNKDEEWGSITALSVFNGNIYALDSGNDEVYKYLVAENGYSDKSSYFKSGESVDLLGSHSLAVDGSLYIATSKSVYKYTSGIRDEFNLELPENQKPAIKKLITSKDLNKIYLLDITNSKVFIVSKDGQYERQIESS
ncbi:MAG TPA: hypothetical protein VK338_01605, partial [Candidatus Nitrosocosmicus sp.]|nr:hypothetical protein [Candidatus Nitrosocosmicus sp.]